MWLTSNCMVFLVRFGINLLLWGFQKYEITLAKAAWNVQFKILKNTFMQIIIPEWTWNHMITFAKGSQYMYVNYKNCMMTCNAEGEQSCNGWLYCRVECRIFMLMFHSMLSKSRYSVCCGILLLKKLIQYKSVCWNEKVNSVRFYFRGSPIPA